MKKLHLIRHAEAGWANATTADIDRTLNQQGVSSCKIMAEPIVQAGCDFEHVFCSTAVRAQSTIENITQHLTDRKITWELDDALYTFDSNNLLTWCYSLEDSMHEIVIIGHNPALTDFCNQMSNRNIGHMPTCSYVQLAFKQDSWQDLATHSTEHLSFLTPTMFV